MGARASTPSRLSPVLQRHEAPECQLMPVGTGRLVYMLHQISRKSGTASGARSCRSHLIPLSCQLGGAATAESDSAQQERLRAQPSPTDMPRPQRLGRHGQASSCGELVEETRGWTCQKGVVGARKGAGQP